MTDHFATAPFGGGRIGAPEFRRRAALSRRRTQIAAGGGGDRRNDDGRAEKWQLIRALSEARAAYGLSDRTLAVLEALLSFHPERELDGAAPIVVFPSNAELSLRSRGMADATLRRHLAALVAAGLVLRRDSPNGKRYALRGDDGAVESAFGFDLSPLALAAPAIHQAAEEARARQRLCQRLRGEITVHLRDVAGIVEAGMAERRAGDWTGFMERLAPLAQRLSRSAPHEVLARRRDEIAVLRRQVEETYLSSLSEQEMSGNDAGFERQYQNSNTEPQFEKGSEKELKRGGDRKRDEDETAPRNGHDGSAETAGRAPETKEVTKDVTKGEPVTLSYLLAVCPQLGVYAKTGISGWRDVLATAGLVRSMLGISPDAWAKAQAAMGEMGAAAAVAAILERSHAIRSPGGYLRVLTERAEQGRFSLRPMLAALERGRAK